MVLRVLASLVLLVFLVGGVGLYSLKNGSPPAFAVDLLDHAVGQPVSADPRPIHFVVQPGEDAAVIGDHLAADGLIRSPLAFRLLVRFRGLAPHLVAGDYQLRADQSLDEIISILAQGRLSGGMLTIPEGWRALEISDALDRSHITSRQEFLRVVQARQVTLPASLDALPSGLSLEGYLFPDSYRFEPHTPAQAIAQTMVDDFARHLTPDLTNGFRNDGLSLPQSVTLASIVEREAVVASERPIIASVYLNRLHRGMKLQADPTVQYALVPLDATPASTGAAGYWKRSLTFADLRVQSPYNTYEVTGLPPGPICNPGLASLEAVAHSATTDYLYFVARPDGTHAFAQTLQEQEQNVAKYQP